MCSGNKIAMPLWIVELKVVWKIVSHTSRQNSKEQKKDTAIRYKIKWNILWLNVSTATIAETRWNKLLPKNEEKTWEYIYICSSFCCGFAVWVQIIVCRSFAFFGQRRPPTQQQIHRSSKATHSGPKSSSIVWCVWHVAIWVLHVFAAPLNAALEACACRSILPEKKTTSEMYIWA